MLQARAGCRQAFGRLVVQYAGPVQAIIRSFLADPGEAEDLAQEVFVRAHQSLPSLRDPDRFSSWLYQIARNRCRKWLARRRRRPEMQPFAAVGEIPAPAPREGAGDERVRAALARLPARFRQVLHLRHLEERSREEIAGLLGLTVNGVNTRLYRARRMLRRCYLDGGRR